MLLAKEVSSNIAIRSSLLQALTKSKDDVIDFQGVDFISRAAAHEYLKWKQGKSVIERNISPQVRKMFETVILK